MTLEEDVDESENLEEDTKYKIKLDTPKSEPAFDDSGSGGLDAFADAPADAPADDAGGFGDEGEKPFDSEPFDAGVEASEEEDPEKYIQQLAGKIGTSIRKYNDERGEPDFDLEKYAINSVVSASHTSEMDENDQDDIIRKIKTSGAADDSGDAEVEAPADEEGGFGDEEAPAEEPAFGDEEGELDEVELVGYDDDAGRGEEAEMLRHLATGDDYIEPQSVNPTKQRLKNFTSDDRFHEKSYKDDFDSVQKQDTDGVFYKDYYHNGDEDELGQEDEMLRHLDTGEDYLDNAPIDYEGFNALKRIGELHESKKNSTFAKNDNMRDTIKGKLDEMAEPIEPATKPVVVPGVKPPSPRRKRIWETKPHVKPPAKMEDDGEIK